MSGLRKRMTTRTVDPEADAPLLHDWFTRPYAAFWGMGAASLEDVRAAHRTIDADPHHRADLGLLDGEPAFLCERYDPAHHELAGVYDVAEGDLGMHVLVAPADVPVHGFTHAVMTTVLDLCFADPQVQRVVVEPDVRNTAIHILNARVGFEVAGEVTLSDKNALLSFCTRHGYRGRLSA